MNYANAQTQARGQIPRGAIGHGSMIDQEAKRAADCVGPSQAPASQAIETLFMASEHLSAMLQRLEGRLDAVLTPMECGVGGGERSQPTEMPKAPVVNALMELGRRQSAAIDRVQSMIDRLAV